MKKLLLAGTALTFAGLANAADLPVKAQPYQGYNMSVPSWTGWYIGPKVGYGWNWSGLDVTAPGGGAALGNAPHGFTGGVQLGYDLQVGAFVFGIVSDINGANFQANNTSFATLASGATTNWWGTTNAKLGLAGFGNHLMPYVFAGVAYGGTKASFTMPTVASAVSTTSTGWDAGAGIETRLDRNWSLLIEVKYIDLGSTNIPVVAAITGHQAFQFGVVEGGFNYRF